MTRYFIRCLGANLPADRTIATRDGIPHVLNHPASPDRDYYRSIRAARTEALRLTPAFPRVTFVVEEATFATP